MKGLVAAALLVAAHARAAERAPPAEETKVAQITPAALPPVASVPRYGAPASLPPVTAQLFRLGGMLEVQPMFAFSIGDPFWRTLGMGVRVEHHFDERWSISGHAIGGVSLLVDQYSTVGTLHIFFNVQTIGGKLHSHRLLDEH